MDIFYLHLCNHSFITHTIFFKEMRDDYCNLCDKTIKLSSKNKYLNTRLHKTLSMSVINRYHVKNSVFLEIEDIFKNTFMIIMKNLDFMLIYLNEICILITLSSV